MELNIANIFSNFIDSAPDAIKSIFSKYCLGIETSNALSTKEYITLLRRSLYYKTDLGRRRVNYTRVNPQTYLHNQLTMFVKKTDYVNSIYVPKESYIGKYPDITISNYEYYTGIVFLIHKDIEYSTIDVQELVKLASAWYDYSIDIILGITYPKNIYRYANRNEIYHSDKKLNSKELKKLKIYTNHIFGNEVISYE